MMKDGTTEYVTTHTIGSSYMSLNVMGHVVVNLLKEKEGKERDANKLLGVVFCLKRNPKKIINIIKFAYDGSNQIVIDIVDEEYGNKYLKETLECFLTNIASHFQCECFYIMCRYGDPIAKVLRELIFKADVNNKLLSKKTYYWQNKSFIERHKYDNLY